MADKIGVFIVAGNRLLREALCHAFRNRADIGVIGSSEQPNLSLKAIAATRPHVLLANGAMRGVDWMAYIPEALRLTPETRVVLFGMEEDQESFFRSLRAGIAGYLLSEASTADLVCAVRIAARGGAVCPPKLCRALFHYVARQGTLPNPRLRAEYGLTRREQLILPLIAQGLTNKEIAGRLNLSEQTVKNHIHRILRKLGTPDRLSAVHALEATAWNV